MRRGRSSLPPVTALISLCAGLLLAGCGAAGPGPAARHVAAVASSSRHVAAVASSPRNASRSTAGTHHYIYVFLDGAMLVYDIDHGQRLVQHLALPGVTGIRGVVASPATRVLYISHGGDGGGEGTGSLLAYNLVTAQVLWDRGYPRGVDSMAINRAGTRIYMPDGELSPDGIWTVINAGSGAVIGRIDAGLGPHNTVLGLNGRTVYLGGRNSPYLDVASTATDRVIKRIGPLTSGVRPFTVNGAQTLAYTTATGFLGFQVSSIKTGQVLDTVTFGPRFPYDRASFAPSAPSHGISLSPDERRLWVIDAPNSFVHVFDVSRPESRPRLLASLKLSHPLTGQQAPCRYDCARDGWLLHSRSGCYVYVGDSGDVFNAVTLRVSAFLPALRNSRQYIEIDWRGGLPVSATARSGVGYVVDGHRPPPPRCPG